MTSRRSDPSVLLAGLAWLLLASPELLATPGVAPDPADSPALAKRPTTPVLREISVQSTGRKTGTCKLILDLSTQLVEVEVDRTAVSPITSTQTLHKSVMAPIFSRDFVSAAALAAKARPFEDGLMAAVEQAADQAIGAAPGRIAFFKALHGLLVKDSSDPARAKAAARVAAALELGGTPVLRPGDPAAVQAVRTAFLRRLEQAQPLSFYTWSPALRGIFQRDRLLSEPLDPAEATAIARVLAASRGSRRAYRALLDLNAVINNPLRSGWNDLGTVPRPGKGSAKLALVPPSRTVAADLLEEMTRAKPTRPDFDVAREVVRRVRSERLSLSPTASSGWMDHLLHSLTPLLVPNRLGEDQYRHASEEYEEYLEGLFRAMLAQTQELGIKGGSGFGLGGYGKLPGWRLTLTPAFTLEPLPTHYLRRARAYRFIRQALSRILGPATLSRLRGLRPEGAMNIGLLQELRSMESLYYGAYLASAIDLGMPTLPQKDLGLPGGPAVSLAAFRKWAQQRSSDPDVGTDVRMMVPVLYDGLRNRTKVWVLLGAWEETLKIRVDPENQPQVVKILDPQGRAIPRNQAVIKPSAAWFTVPRLVVAEVWVSRVLDRDAFRRHCDRWKTSKAILANLR